MIKKFKIICSPESQGIVGKIYLSLSIIKRTTNRISKLDGELGSSQPDPIQPEPNPFPASATHARDLERWRLLRRGSHLE